MYASLALDESRVMSSFTDDQWYGMPRPERANKVARAIAERRIDLYFSLRSRLEMKNREG